jgi:hypothetical protein
MFLQINAEPLWRNVLNQLLTFLYSIAHYVGMFIVYLFNMILPKVQVPTDLIDPIGFLAIITAFLILVQVAKKIATLIVVIAWVLIAIRIGLVYLQ